jgi:hypothetical protein
LVFAVEYASNGHRKGSGHLDRDILGNLSAGNRQHIKFSSPSEDSRPGWSQERSEAVVESRRAEHACNEKNCLRTWVERAKARNRKTSTIGRWRRMHFPRGDREGSQKGRRMRLSRWARIDKINALYLKKARLLSRNPCLPQLEAGLSSRDGAKRQEITKEDALKSVSKQRAISAGLDQTSRVWKAVVHAVWPTWPSFSRQV